MSKTATNDWIRLLTQTIHYGPRPVYLNPDLVAGVHKDQDGRTVVTVAGHNMTVEAPGLRERMKVGVKDGTLERDFWPVNFVKVAGLLGFEVAQADRPTETAKKAEEIKEPDKK